MSEQAPASVLELVDRLVQQAVSDAERRTEIRVPFIAPIKLYYRNGEVASAEGLTRDVTPGGVGMFHRHKLKDKQLTVEIWLDAEEHVTANLEIVWSRPLALGWYDSGARFVES